MFPESVYYKLFLKDRCWFSVLQMSSALLPKVLELFIFIYLIQWIQDFLLLYAFWLLYSLFFVEIICEHWHCCPQELLLLLFFLNKVKLNKEQTWPITTLINQQWKKQWKWPSVVAQPAGQILEKFLFLSGCFQSAFCVPTHLRICPATFHP